MVGIYKHTCGNGKIIQAFHVFSNFTPPSQQIPATCHFEYTLEIMFAVLLAITTNTMFIEASKLIILYVCTYVCM